MTQKERGIIFSTELIPKIMDGTKTQTRRTWGLERMNKKPDNWRVGSMDIAGRIIWVASHIDRSVAPKLKCPYGQVGDRLWLKETWAGDVPNGIDYKADGHSYGEEIKVPWKSPRFMPRWASRIGLEIIDLRAERLQDISEEDAIAEGWDSQLSPLFKGVPLECRPRVWFAQLWDSINAKRYPWEANSWVWVIGFKEVK